MVNEIMRDFIKYIEKEGNVSNTMKLEIWIAKIFYSFMPHIDLFVSLIRNYSNVSTMYNVYRIAYNVHMVFELLNPKLSYANLQKLLLVP